MRPFELGFEGTPLRAKLLEAVLRGEKTATAGLLVDYEREGEALPEAGERFRLVGVAGEDAGVVEVTAVRVLRLDETDLEFARAEGEGFESVDEWRAAHEDFWRGYVHEIREWLEDPDWDVRDETLYVQEWFRLVEPG